jgi:hypothetical protein
MEHLRIFATDSAYIAPLGNTESITTYKRRIYDTILTLRRPTTGPLDMSVTRLWPDTDWATVWRNLQAAPVRETTKAVWYRILHDILPTNERLYKIRLNTTDRFRHCDRKDTIQHRLIECGDGALVWEWTRLRLAAMLRTIPRRIPPERLLRPHFRLWPPQRHRAVLWVLAQLVLNRSQQRRALTLHDYIDFLRRMKWKMYQKKPWQRAWAVISAP